MKYRIYAFIAVSLLFSSITSAWAQIPSLLPGKSLSPAPSSSSGKDTTVVVDINKELADAQARFQETQNSANNYQSKLNQATLPADTRSELLKQFNQRQTLADRYAQQIEYLKQLQTLDQKIVLAKQQRDNWTPPAGSPPWPLTDGDQVRFNIISLESRIGQLNKDLAGLTDQITTYAREKSDAEVRLRQIQESLDKNPTKQSDNDRKTLDNAQLTLAFKSAILYRTDLERRLKEKQLTLLNAELETVTKTWNYYDGRFTLSPEILASAKGDIQFIVDRDRDLELKALAKSESTLASLNKAQENYQALENKKASPAQLAQAKANLDIAQAADSMARTEVDRLRQLIEMGGYAQKIWDARAELYATTPPSAVRVSEIAESVKLGLTRVSQSRGNLVQALTNKEQEAFDLREALLFSKDDLDRKALTAKLQTANAEADSIRLVQTVLDKFEQYLLLLQSELGEQAKQKTTKEWFVSIWQKLVKSAQNIWQYELFTVDDVVVADGKEIKTIRSVTVGKSVGALSLLLIGYMLIAWFIRSSIALAERRMGLKTPTATVIRRWATLIATGTLIILSFNLVQIPLSVFAFLGGALAIGVGFGTQNILKNLISGAILLIERPIRMGDFVEIDGIRGRVTSIGIRFSTIHSSDGIDTLIPNSELVEKKLTNWTFSNPDIRREIQIGVAYGTDPTQVLGLIQSAALAHPDVMPSPAPTVLLKDLGDNALIFTLRYWIRVAAGTDAARVDSDLRRDVLVKLKSAGIELPYPQRDVHLSSEEPLRVVIDSPPTANH
jgi:small-conductance mechanosensitive channel